mmetsp:Transcript_136706/g.249178  ORF Transcript_136706/g.249178 Transcript_136706/m.249178 type:complete len:388 (-) Transcript_136706:18-1181(-)
MFGASLALLLLSWTVARLSCTTAASVVASSAADVSVTGSLVRKKQLVVACNGFPDGESATVGVRQESAGSASVTGLRRLFSRSQLRLDGWRVKHQLGEKPVLRPAPASLSLPQLQPFGTSPGSHSPTSPGSHSLRAHRTHRPSGTFHPTGSRADADGDVVWTRQLAYGECEEYHVNLEKRRFFFAPPNGSAICEFEPPHIEKDARTIQQFLVVLTRPEASSSRCTTRSAVIKKPELKKRGAERLVQLATIDAFTQAEASRENETQEEAELNFRDLRKGLDPLAPLPQEAIVRIEDKINAEAISSEVLASRTLGWGRTYSLEPGSFHVILEDMRGTHMPDRKDVSFKEGCTYVAVRVGKAGDPMYPERLIFRRVEDALPLFASADLQT